MPGPDLLPHILSRMVLFGCVNDFARNTNLLLPTGVTQFVIVDLPVDFFINSPTSQQTRCSAFMVKLALLGIFTLSRNVEIILVKYDKADSFFFDANSVRLVSGDATNVQDEVPRQRFKHKINNAFIVTASKCCIMPDVRLMMRWLLLPSVLLQVVNMTSRMMYTLSRKVERGMG